MRLQHDDDDDDDENVVAQLLVYRMRSADHTSDALISLHLLRDVQRIEYKIAVYTDVHSSIRRTASTLLMDLRNSKQLIFHKIV